MQYLYYFANASLVLRLLRYLSHHPTLLLESVTVIYLVDRWVVRVRLRSPLLNSQAGDFAAFLAENGAPFSLTNRLAKVLVSLDKGISVTDVMNTYHVVVVSHGALQPDDIQAFCHNFEQGLGYCPPSLV